MHSFTRLFAPTPLSCGDSGGSRPAGLLPGQSDLVTLGWLPFLSGGTGVSGSGASGWWPDISVLRGDDCRQTTCFRSYLPAYHSSPLSIFSVLHGEEDFRMSDAGIVKFNNKHLNISTV